MNHFRIPHILIALLGMKNHTKFIIQHHLQLSSLILLSQAPRLVEKMMDLMMDRYCIMQDIAMMQAKALVQCNQWVQYSVAYCDSALPSSASNIAYFQQDTCQTAPERENVGEKGHAFLSSSLHFHQFPLCLNPHLLFSSPCPSPHHPSSAYAMLAQFSWRRM